ncbi:MAG: hypothetical protein LUD71_00105, partial [Clostridiales bacterium]|nr:hypothetical protein [Clostridiales bacterium]
MKKDKQDMDNILYRDLLGQYYNNSIKEEHRQNQLLAPLDINYDTFRCLRYLSEHPDGVEPRVMAKV